MSEAMDDPEAPLRIAKAAYKIRKLRGALTPEEQVAEIRRRINNHLASQMCQELGLRSFDGEWEDS